MTKSKAVLIKRVNPNNVQPVYTNDIVVTHSNDAFFLTFSILEPPAILSEDEILDINEIKASAISKIIVSPEFFKSLIDSMSENYKKYQDRIATMENEEEK